MSTRETLEQICVDVVDNRFLFYGWKVIPISLQPTDYAIEIERNKPVAEATGTTAELHNILEKYLHSRGFRIIEINEHTGDTLKIVVRSA
jgi:hypothetical protein